MNDIFNSDIRSALQTAASLAAVGEATWARKICISCVKDAAKYNKTDILEFFYGSKVYDQLKTVEDAARFIYIAACAKKAYEAIDPLGAAVGSGNPWAVADNQDSDAEMAEFFRWIRSDHILADEDVKYFEILTKSAKNKGKIHFKMVEKLKKMKLTAIVSLLVNRSRMITEEGELR
jgi:hypothetical protein